MSGGDLPRPWGPQRAVGGYPPPKRLITDAARDASSAEVRSFLVAGADPNALCPVFSFTPLVAAVVNGDCATVAMLLEHPSLDVNRVAAEGMTALMYAAAGAAGSYHRGVEISSSGDGGSGGGGASGGGGGRDGGSGSNEKGGFAASASSQQSSQGQDLVAALLQCPGCDRYLFNDRFACLV